MEYVYNEYGDLGRYGLQNRDWNVNTLDNLKVKMNLTNLNSQVVNVGFLGIY